MAERVVRNEAELELAQRFIASRKLPFTMRLSDGVARSIEQNRLQRMWLNEAAEQLGDQTPEELRGYCKLRFGVPILRAGSDDFREKYDRLIKPHPYEAKIEMMMEPLDFPVTRLMTTLQKAEYLDKIYVHFNGQGIQLTEPRHD